MTDRGKKPDLSLTDAERAELTRDILERTSGSACDRAHELIGEAVSDDLAGTDAALLRSHLEHCDGCAALSQAMAWTKELLPGMACVEPDAAFAADVLAATSRAKRPATIPMWRHRLREYGRRLWMRPRFALEVAYVGTMALLLLFGAPLSTGRHAPNRALDVAAATVAPDLAGLRAAMGRGAVVWTASRDHATGALRNFDADLDERGRRAGAAAADLRTDAAMLLDAAGSLEFERAAGHLGAMGGDLAGMWHGFFADPAPGATKETDD